MGTPLTLDRMGHPPPFIIKISKIGLRRVLCWPKLGIEPTFHDPGTFGGFGKQIAYKQTDKIHVL